ncbi:J domain-containing protein [Dyadobacter sp. MSC1_007]|jgi:molecular chaperone DnaJ|uniref:J domain-containing protein n=1 Tax=Dyadobacter sp. MSC1_007 TaxID=2909264 RepID=UPI00202F5953|nr:J domain-containing protein [Dyadobacter sp. MSC1_007]
MEFRDLYMTLEVPPTATEEEIVASYRRLCKVWHPDANRGKDTTEKMQDIVAAKLLLMDTEARRRYDLEYTRVKGFTQTSTKTNNTTQKASGEPQKPKPVYTDPELEIWIHNAHQQSVEITRRLISELREQFGIGISGALRGMKNFMLGRKIFE